MLENKLFILFLGVFILRNLIEALLQHKEVYVPSKQEKGLPSLLVLSFSFLISGGAVGYFLASSASINLFVYAIGIILFCAGYVGRRVGLKTIGENYSTYIRLRSEHQLVKTGVYAKVRHPLYAFYLLEMAALMLICWNITSLIAFFCVLLATLPRIQREEALLSDAFGEVFEAHRKKSKRLIPYIY